MLPIKYDYANSVSTASNPAPIIIQASGPAHHARERERYPSAEFMPKKNRREAFEKLQGEIDKMKGDDDY